MPLPKLKGEYYTDDATRKIYATDASAYREIPRAVAIPKDKQDIVALVKYAGANGSSLIPRTAGTSLAGQVVGKGIVVDVSKYFNQIIEINAEEQWAWVQPGVVRDDLNQSLRPYGLFFAPETSTANRAMIGGMIGNNSCGANSVVYGSTRAHLLELKVILADGSEAWFGPVDHHAFLARCNGFGTSGDLHTRVYFDIKEILSAPKNQKYIKRGFPDPKITRRNTGYALDILLGQRPFHETGPLFNFCALLAGSEGTLAFTTAAKIKLTPLPSAHKSLVAIHCHSIDESLKSNLVALEYEPSACELMDHYILEATERNTLYRENRFFLEGSPKAILVVELTKGSRQTLETATREMIGALKNAHLGYAYPVIAEADKVKKVWGLRKAGLGLLSNVPGDEKPVPVIEDTAVHVQHLPDYIRDFNAILKKHGLYSVHYAHASSGELHLRPILNLKTQKGVLLYRKIAEEIVNLVKKYNGSLSGEHGDGRLRGEFIPRMLGSENYELLKRVKESWDPENIFNPGKIVDTPPMDTSLRFKRNQTTRDIPTTFDFSDARGYLRAAEMCNGSGDCRKSELSGGTMCPSYMATRNERDTTRARANILREVITLSENKNPMDSKEIKEVMDLCLACKGCRAECPSNVDVGKLKAEWQHQYYRASGVPLRSKMIGNFSTAMKLAGIFPLGYRWLFDSPLLGGIAKSILGFAPQRSMPALSKVSLKSWFKKFEPTAKGQEVYLFCDEFTNHNDAEIGIKTVQLLDRIGCRVKMADNAESGRSHLSKGLLDRAKELAEQNVDLFSEIVSPDTPLIGIEPSAILSFRDEYITLLRGEKQRRAKALSKHVFTIEEFLARKLDRGELTQNQFTRAERLIKVHGHCHQKALSSMTPVKKILSVPENFEVHMIASGCCGMAGAFGYEKEHYEVSMRIGELVLFPAIRKLPQDVIIAAAGTSCRHQVKDGTGRKAFHPVEILSDALIE